MSILFFFVFLLAIVGLIMGLIKPSKVKLDSRKKVTSVFCGIIFLSLFLMIITSPSTPETETTVSTPEPQTEVVTPTPVVNQKATVKSQPQAQTTQAVVSPTHTKSYQQIFTFSGKGR